MKNLLTNKTFNIISIALNIILIAVISLIAFTFKEKLIEKFLSKQAASVVMLGDSLVEHGNWNYLLGRNDVLNSGAPGFTTSHFVFMLRAEVLNHKPKVCFIEGGINDIAVGIPVERTLENIRSLIDTLQSNQITVVLQSIVFTRDTSQNEVIASLNQHYQTIAKEKNISYIDLNTKLSRNQMLKEEYSKDGVHLVKEAYPIWAQLLKGHIAKVVD